MKIKITIIEIDFPDKSENQEQPVYKPDNPLKTLCEKLRKETETGRDSTLWTTPLEATLYGTLLTQ